MTSTPSCEITLHARLKANIYSKVSSGRSMRHCKLRTHKSVVIVREKSNTLNRFPLLCGVINPCFTSAYHLAITLLRSFTTKSFYTKIKLLLFPSYITYKDRTSWCTSTPTKSLYGHPFTHWAINCHSSFPDDCIYKQGVKNEAKMPHLLRDCELNRHKCQ